jgi:hypothetical protein
MNGIATGVSSISPALIGFVIGVTGKYEGGLFVLVGAGMVAAAATAILVFQKY